MFLSAELDKRGCIMERKLGEKSGEKVFILDPIFRRTPSSDFMTELLNFCRDT